MTRVTFLLCAIASFSSAYAKSLYVEGAGGVPLAVTDVGPLDAPGILFIHGIGFGRDSFRAQFESSLADRYHLVAFDLRGHGMSGKPWTVADYSEPGLWAQDVANVMAATGLKRPVVVAWSYGSLVIADVIRINGTADIGGLVLVAALGGLVDAPAPQGDMPEELARARRLQPMPDLNSQREASRLVAPFLTAGNVPTWWPESALALNLMVPPYARPLLRQHPAKNADLVSKLRLPLLIVHGRHDAAVSPQSVDHLRRAVPGSAASLYENSGHSPFAEDASRFNAELAIFVDRVRSGL
ncbi:MAG: alpha/beta hydrolase [Rhodospirillaceae bacterium]|nr:alpha/beta hydrolase [Rhodospirillaceae bacterium]